MRRKDKEIKDCNIIEEILQKGEICRIGLSDNGQPYIVPVNYGYQNNRLFFHSAIEGRKIDILRKNPHICFEVTVDDTIVTGEKACDWGMRYRSVMGEGTVLFLEDTTEKRAALDIIMSQYDREGVFTYGDGALERVTIIQIDIISLSGKQSGNF